MDELQLTEFASKIDRFENDYGNYMRIHFKRPKDITALKKSLTELGITDVRKEWENGVLDSDIEHVFEVNYQYSPQRKVIDDLKRRHTRLRAWRELRGSGGTQMSDAEQEFFIKEDKRKIIAQAEWEKMCQSIPTRR